MRDAIRLARKDLLRSIRDRSALAVSIVAPLTLAFILSSVLPDEDLGVGYGFVDEDGGIVAQTFLDEVLRPLEEGFADVEKIDSRPVAIRRAEADEVAAAFILPEGLSDSVQQGRPARIEVVISPESDVGAPIATSIAQGYAAELNAIGLSVATAAFESGTTSPDPELVRRIQAAARQMGSPITVSEEGAGNREFDTKTFFAAGMAVFFLFFTTQFGAQSLLRERREGTLTRLLAAPISRASVVGGKALFTYALGVVSLVTLILASTFLMEASWGAAGGVTLMVLAAVFAAMGVQAVVATLAKTDEQAASYGSVIAVTLGLLGGTFFPLSQAPDVVATLSYATPHAWIMRGFGDLSGGAGDLADIARPLIALVLFGGITGGIALIKARGIVAAR